MKLVRSTLLSLATLAVVFIALLAGCSGSDPLSTTVGSLVLEFQITDPNSTRFEEADLSSFQGDRPTCRGSGPRESGRRGDRTARQRASACWT